MAISHPEETQTLTCINTDMQPQQTEAQVSKKRSRNNKNQHVDNNSGELSDSSSASSTARAPETKQRRRRRQRGRGGAKKASNNKATTSKEPELSVEEQEQYVAMDCEMVGVGMGGHKSVLARVTIVDWNGDIVLDQYVKPTETITDYRTFVSGITEEDLEDAQDITVCRTKVLQVLQDKILVGHHLKNDLKAVGVSHPWYDTRDTAKWEPFMKIRFDDGILWPRKLKELCQEKLKREIQVMGQAHSPIEDAIAALDLYKLVRNKWEKAMAYKVKKTREIMEQQVSAQ
uniref:RNA exonuclease 4 n=1 Tax=Entomoneis paludosa TaxID=265537 RepID=A0A7S2Y5Y4_9STRA|mmetsp:Transcript_18899/g.39153  ORF Transcript_18899/g.39153 Transcript_18899/m.39153 type:complete len:288 (+) Transcript_18899:117-980(+)|eukprot:CAMPEP_0172445332 /NCGR_PEP_ID=MMETSP1065-20121228/5166_1 /TAXON_ID=265537 /ORGANISM="Amphiprora paludosa, Strain CCMP125" /LENGTH=287 /DNA_ID=CAMNT_0013196131 /DNA_START=89 /DNA_END=952 /DNA_ORIENTATION=+